MTASLRDAAQMALDELVVLKKIVHGGKKTIGAAKFDTTIAALRAALALPYEPVAAPGPAGWVDAGNWTRADWIAYMDANQWGECATPQPAPVQQKPLSVEDAAKVFNTWNFTEADDFYRKDIGDKVETAFIDGLRAGEAAHGIKGAA